VEAVWPAHGGSGDKPACSAEGHQPGKQPHPLQVRGRGSRSLDPAQTVGNEGRTHETYVGIDRRVCVHPRFRSRSGHQLNRPDRDTRPSGNTSHNSELRHAVILASPVGQEAGISAVTLAWLRGCRRPGSHRIENSTTAAGTIVIVNTIATETTAMPGVA
jgi:hypothetical protein